MTRKARFGNIFEKFSEKKIGDNLDKGYDYLCDSFFVFLGYEEALTSFKFESFDWVFSRLTPWMMLPKTFSLLILSKLHL